MAIKGEQSAAEAKAVAPAKKRGKRLIIIGVLLVVIAIAVAGVLFFSKKKAAADEAQGEEGVKAENVEKDVVTVAYPLEPFIVNIYDNDESRYLKIKVEFEIATKEVAVDLESRKARIRDTILILLTTKTLEDIREVKGKNLLREEILTSINKILPLGKVTRVYFTDFVVQ